MKKERKVLFAFSRLLMVLSQVFVLAFCSVIAVATVNDSAKKSLFDTANALATMSYAEIGEDRLQWTINLEKKRSELPTKVKVQLMADRDGVRLPLVFENLQVVNYSEEIISVAIGDGTTNTSLYEVGASTTGKVELTFETNRDFGKLVVSSQLLTTEANVVDLLSEANETVFEIPIVKNDSESLQPMEDVTGELTITATEKATVEESTEKTVERIEEQENLAILPNEARAILPSTNEGNSSSAIEKQEVQESARVLGSVSGLSELEPNYSTLFDSAVDMKNGGDESDIFLYNGVLTGNHSAIAADIEGAMFIFGNSVIPEGHFFFGGYFPDGTVNGGLGLPLTERHRISLVLGGEIRRYSEGLVAVSGIDNSDAQHPGYLLTNETQATTGWLSQLGTAPYQIDLRGPSKYMLDDDFLSLQNNILSQQQKVYSLLASKIANFDALENKEAYGGFDDGYHKIADMLYYSSEDPSVLIYKLPTRADKTALLPAFNLDTSFIADENIKQIIVYSDAEKIVASHTDGVVDASIAEKVVYYLPNATQVTNYYMNSGDHTVLGVIAPELPTKFNDDAVNQFNDAYFSNKVKKSAAYSGFLIAPQATVAMTNANWNGYLWAHNLYQEGGWELHNFYNPWVEEQVKFRFQLYKHSSVSESIAIEGATFVFYRKKDGRIEYLKTNDGIGGTEWSSNETDAKTFLTDSTGSVLVANILEDATYTYYFQEIATAPGYVMPDDPHFQVEMDSITKRPNLSEIPNIPTPPEKITSLRVEKTWDWTAKADEVPSAAKTVEFQLMRKLKDVEGEEYEEYREPYSLTYDENAIDEGVQVYEWSNLPLYEVVDGEEVGPYEYTVVEVDHSLFEIEYGEADEITIDELAIAQNCDIQTWSIQNPSFMVIPNGDSGWIIWTATHLSDEEKADFIEAVEDNNLNDGIPDSDELFVQIPEESTIRWLEGNVKFSPDGSNEYVEITLNPKDSGSLDVRLEFTKTNLWTQLIVGSHAMKKVPIINRLISLKDITIQKQWMLDDSNPDENNFNTQEDIQLVLQRKIGDVLWNHESVESIETFTILKGSPMSSLSHVFTVPEKVKVVENGVTVYKIAAYRVIEKVKDGTGNYTKDRATGYETPEITSTNDIDYLVTNTLMTTSFSFTKIDSGNGAVLPGVSFTLSRVEGGYIRDGITGVQGELSFSGLPIGNYILTETATVAGYQIAGPWTFKVSDESGNMVIVGTGDSPVEDGARLGNNLKLFDFTVYKVDELGNALPGASFTLKGPDDSGSLKLPTNEEAEISTFHFEDLTPGTYKLVETSAPNGYIGISDEIVIVIEPDGTVTIDNETLLDDGNGGVILKPNLESGVPVNNSFSYTVINNPEVLLPATGGSGTLMFVVTGISAVLVTGLYFLQRKEREVT